MELIGMLFFIVFFTVFGATPIILLFGLFGVVGVVNLIPEELLIPLFKLSLCSVLVLVSIIFLITI